MVAMEENLAVPAEILVYGDLYSSIETPINSKLLQLHKNDKGLRKTKGCLFLNPKPETHYSIYEDSHGTHILPITM